jgi:hypothetical protein
MEQEIKDIIQKNLPAQVGEVLRVRLEQADLDSARVKALENSLKSREELIDTQSEALQKYREFDSRNSKLDKREAELNERERNLKIELLEYQLDSEKEKTSFTKEVALGLVRNTNYRKSILDNETQAGYQGPNGWVQPQQVSKSFIEDKTEQ